MRATTDRSGLEGFSKSFITESMCFVSRALLVAAIVCLPLVIIGAYGMAIFIAVTVVVVSLGHEIIKCHKKNRAYSMPIYNWSPPRETPMSTISSSVSPALPSPRMRRASEPTFPVTTPDHPTSRYPLYVSSRLSHAYYNHHAGFSSPIIASLIENQSSHVSSSNTWHSSTSCAPSAPVPSSLTGYTAAQFAANVQPPAYLAVAEGNTGLIPTHHATPATDEGPARVFEPSNDGLPSYEAAMSTRQPPAYEAPRIPRDDGSTIND